MMRQFSVLHTRSELGGYSYVFGNARNILPDVKIIFV